MKMGKCMADAALCDSRKKQDRKLKARVLLGALRMVSALTDQQKQHVALS